MINPFACKCGTESTTTDAGCKKLQCKQCKYKSLRIDNGHVWARARIHWMCMYLCRRPLIVSTGHASSQWRAPIQAFLCAPQAPAKRRRNQNSAFAQSITLPSAAPTAKRTGTRARPSAKKLTLRMDPVAPRRRNQNFAFAQSITLPSAAPTAKRTGTRARPSAKKLTSRKEPVAPRRRNQNFVPVPRSTSRSAAPTAKRTGTRARPSAKKLTSRMDPVAPRRRNQNYVSVPGFTSRSAAPTAKRTGTRARPSAKVLTSRTDPARRKVDTTLPLTLTLNIGACLCVQLECGDSKRSMSAMRIEMHMNPVPLFPLIFTTGILCVDRTGKCEKLNYEQCEKTYKGQVCSWDGGECKTKGRYRPHGARARIHEMCMYLCHRFL